MCVLLRFALQNAHKSQEWVASRGSGQSTTKGSAVNLREHRSINDIRTAIRELSARAEVARKEGRPADAEELERRVQGYREELAARP